MRKGLSPVISLVASYWILVGPVPGQTPDQQRRDPVPPPGQEASNPERDIFVPIWTEPLGPGATLPDRVPRRRADYVWSGVPLQSSRLEAGEHPKGANATLLAIRPLAGRGGNPPPSRLEVLIRLDKPARPPAKPFLEVLDRGTLLQSRAWGRLSRRTPAGEEWLFVILDPVPAPSGPVNPISARVLRTPDPSRRLELRLVAEAPTPR